MTVLHAVDSSTEDWPTVGAQVVRSTSEHGDIWMTAAGDVASVAYQPILDVERAATAGYQALSAADPHEANRPPTSRLDLERAARRAAWVVDRALAAAPTLPTNSFMTLPLPYPVLASRPVRAVLDGQESLRGIVLDITGFTPDHGPDAAAALRAYRDQGALVAVGGDGMPQPELTSIVRLKPSFVRLGRAWVRGLDTSEAKRSAIEVTGRLAGQLDAWILAEGVSSAAELRALCGLGVPLAQGPFIGGPQGFWPDIELSARTALPVTTTPTDGILRHLVQHAYTTRDAGAAAAVLPETTGFDLVVVIDEWKRPTSLFECDPDGGWSATEAMPIHVDTPVHDAVARAMARPRAVRFAPLACTDDAGRLVGVLRVERLMEHLAATQPAAAHP